MDWNNSSSTSIILRSPTAFVSQPSAEISTNLFYNSNQFDRFSGLEIIKHHGPGPVEMMESSIIAPNNMERDIMIMSYGNHQDKIKRRLTANQLELLESSFQQERKLEPDRKMKLARDLGLQPRQVAVWFQNRRARWKAKKLEHLYDALKIEFELVSKEKLKLQEEVLRLKGMLMEQGTTRKQVCNSYKEASCEETVESTSAAVNQSSLSDHQNNPNNTTSQPIYNNRHFLFEVDDYNAVSPSYWAALP